MCAHLLGAWALLQLDSVRRVLHERAPLMVRLLTIERTAATPPRLPSSSLAGAPERRPVEPRREAGQPRMVVSATPTASPPTPTTSAAEVSATVPAEAPALALQAPASVAAVATPAPPSPPAAPVAPPRRLLAATAVRYLVEPPVEVPRASRRAGEHGVVTLRVVVSTAGLPVQVSVHRSSGFARLDEQALWAMRQARFQPHSEGGRAVEVEVIAPIEYPPE